MNRTIRCKSLLSIVLLVFCLIAATSSEVDAQRGRPVLNAARTTFVADNGQLLRGPYTSSEWGDPAPYNEIANMKNLGFNAVHLYGECFDINYPNPGSTAPGYSAARIDSVVAATRDLGLYLVITIGNGANNGNYNYEYVVDFWAFYAQRYANETHVIFEIQNEPVAWGPPYSSPTATPPGAIDMEAAVYTTIRQYAPNTPVLLFTYAVLSGSGGASAALTDISAFNAAVGGDPASIWSNTAVGFHGYGGWQGTTEAVAALLNAGYPCFMTEFGGTEWGDGQGGFGVMQTSELERLNVSWLAFCYIPPYGVSDNVTIPEIYKDRVDRAGMSWVPDYGTWPQQRGVYGNGGRPRATTSTFVSNFLTGTLRIEAEDYDTGGQGMVYNDTDSANLGGQYRTSEGVDIEITPDTDGGYDVGWTANGEWLEYSIYVPEPGFYDLRLRVASPNTGCTARVVCYNLDKTGTWTIPNTGGWQTWTTITKQVFLEFGRQKLRFEILTGGFNLNWVEFSPFTTAPVANGTYKLANQNSGQVIENNTSTHKLVQNIYSGADVQKWILLHLGAGQYRVQSVYDNYYWNTWASTMTWWWGIEAQGQRFIARSSGDGYYRIIPVDSGMNFGVENASLATGAAIVWNEYTGSANQRWGILAPSAPAFPTGLNGVKVSSNQINLTWTASAGATSYNVKRSTTSGGPYTTIASNVTTTSYSDTSVITGTAYYYVVSANTTGGESLNSAEASAPGGSGTILRQWWEGISGTAVSNLTSNANYPDNPTGSSNITSFEAPTNWADNYGTRIRGYVHPSFSGEYTFWIASDDNSELWLSTDDNPANAVKIAYVSDWTNSREWTKFTAQRSAVISLTGGQKYYIEALQKEGSGGDNLAVAWQGPGINQEVIPGVYLSPWVDGDTTAPAAPTGLIATAGNATVSLDWADNSEGDLASYNVYRSTTSGSYGVALITGLTSSSYVDNSVTNGTTYYYVVSAIDTSSNESADSAEVSATPTAPCSPTTITPYTQIDGGAWVQTANATVNVGQTVIFGPQPVSGGSWSWSGPNGFSAATREITLSNIQTNQAGTYTATYTNDCGAQSQQAHIVTVNSAAAPTFVAAGSVTSGTGTISPALPSGIASGDILLLFVETANQAVTISNSNGGTWAEVTNSPQGTGTAAGTSATRLTAFWSRYNGTQGNPTVSDSGNHQLGRMIAIRGAAASGNPWDVTAGGVEATADTSGSIAGATTTVSNTLVVTAIATSLPDSTSTTRFSAWTNANLTSLTERTDNSVTAGNGGGLGIATGVKATAGAYGSTAVTLASSAAKGMLSIAIKN